MPVLSEIVNESIQPTRHLQARHYYPYPSQGYRLEGPDYVQEGPDWSGVDCRHHSRRIWTMASG